jgi:hypothetical protein
MLCRSKLFSLCPTSWALVAPGLVLIVKFLCLSWFGFSGAGSLKTCDRRMRCNCHNRFCLRRTGIIIGPSSLGDVAEYGLSLTSSSVVVLVVAAVALLAKVGVLKGVFVRDVDSSPWFKLVETMRVGQVPEECSEVKGGDVWSSVCLNLHTHSLSCRVCSCSAVRDGCLLSSLLRGRRSWMCCNG